MIAVRPVDELRAERETLLSSIESLRGEEARLAVRVATYHQAARELGDLLNAAPEALLYAVQGGMESLWRHDSAWLLCMPEGFEPPPGQRPPVRRS